MAKGDIAQCFQHYLVVCNFHFTTFDSHPRQKVLKVGKCLCKTDLSIMYRLWSKVHNHLSFKYCTTLTIGGQKGNITAQEEIAQIELEISLKVMYTPAGA